MQKVVIVGAGPVGSLAALYAAMRGDSVELYELRGDPRDASTIPLNFTKSINLAISERGLTAMRSANRPGFIDNVLSEAIPMTGRMIHGRSPTGALWEASQDYDVHGRYINSTDRGKLNTSLLNELEKEPNVKLFFNHKLTGADFKNKKAWFEQKNPSDSPGFRSTSGDDSKSINVTRSPELEVSFDFLIGADGAHSATRYHLMKYARMDYQQEYIDCLWCEFCIGPSKDNEFKISPNHLHIWPGGDFMFIALPSLNKTFVCTLFAPSEHYAALESDPNILLEFFQTHFPGVSPELIPPEDLIEQFNTNPHLPLISLKSSPHHFGSSAVIAGDAAHAVVPFYGQGLNAGLEDVRVLFEILDNHGVYSESNKGDPQRIESLRAAALDAYTRQRVPDTHAINRLSRNNFIEMRAGVKSPLYRMRKALEEALYKYFPGLGWSTQYARVSFSNARYSEVEKATKRQTKVLTRAVLTTFVSSIGLATIGLWKWRWSRDIIIEMMHTATRIARGTEHV
ncbi:kynurenine 3-monooxygenase, mitochondrial precursor [Microsporum canis]|uniref:Kynurenine 3-monooxygenase n=1 Tax=Arthroderma otae (strain ATCC MYA-4605 / CBS 113480) TaxID=554155 RepID=C5FFV0_ARTOC|nr:kynurenine 3-monooxygenase [Microsporum canis CBS 113480]EEQ29635.1 kynurenine 3-monooxygenase [Microsporum canis CBS 113480]